MAFADRSIVDGRAVNTKQFLASLEAAQPIAALADGFTLFLFGTAITTIYQLFIVGTPYAGLDLESYAALSLLASAMFVILSKANGSYEHLFLASKSSVAQEAIYSWLVVVALLSFTAFLLKNGTYFSRGALVTFAVIGSVITGANRLIWRKAIELLVSKNFALETRLLLIRVNEPNSDLGRPKRTSELSARLPSGASFSYEIDIPVNNMHDLKSDMPKVRALIAEGAIDRILVELPQKFWDRVPEVREALRTLPLPIELVLDPVTTAVLERPLKQIGRLLVAEIAREPLTPTERLVKRCLDLLVATTALLLLSPLMLAVAAAIKLESTGPVFFLQDRMGFSGKKFRIFKFRSLRVEENGPQIEQVKREDKRVTRVGRFIRRTSIDELPQLFNVFLGEMSIVGPRPHAIAHDDHYSSLIAEYAMRHHVKPGLTGLSQVIGLRGETPRVEDMKARVETDISYINSWSLWNDLVIIARTSLVVLFQKNAR